MSEQQNNKAAVEEVDDAILLERLGKDIEALDFEAGAFAMPDRARLEPMLVPTANGLVPVIRYRYNEKINTFLERRETYYAVENIGRPVLLFMQGDLETEEKLCDKNDFPGIISHHAEQARRTALGFSSPDVSLGQTHDIRHLSVIVRQAVSHSRHQRQAS